MHKKKKKKKKSLGYASIVFSIIMLKLPILHGFSIISLHL